jgi:hypothetical protein
LQLKSKSIHFASDLQKVSAKVMAASFATASTACAESSRRWSAELNAKETAVPRRQRATIQVASGHREECSTLPPPPGAHGSSSSKKGNICNLLAILIAIFLYVAMQPSLRFKIFFAQHQAFFVAFSLSILGYV